MSNPLRNDLIRIVEACETSAGETPKHWAQKYHLMPPCGWMNDPNGLHQFDGVFHAYYQYGPTDANGDGSKMWGHAVSSDLIAWEDRGVALAPDESFDCHGVYSGSALVHDGRVSMFYTGNVKRPNVDGSFDYTNKGREANTVMVDALDNLSFGPKRLLMTNVDYPSDLTCHVRDPKVWDAGTACGRYLMVQGARRRVDVSADYSDVDDSARGQLFRRVHGDGSCFDQGEVLVFASDDLVNWKLQNRVSSDERFGFMWECPDYFELMGQKLLSICPQGLTGEDWNRRNLYQSGYFTMEGDICSEYSLNAFRLWDTGFDFYAPQTFEAEDGRRILIGWMGLPGDDSYGNDPTVAEGWQHCMTVPRELTVGADGMILQQPVREITRHYSSVAVGEGSFEVAGDTCFDIAVGGVNGAFAATVNDELLLSFKPAEGELPARFEMRFADESRASAGCGRTVRWEPIDEVRNVRIVGDVSSVEVFVNDGALVFSTRIYPEAYGVSVDAAGASVNYHALSI